MSNNTGKIIIFEGACLIYVNCVCVCIVVSNIHCVVFLLCFISSCVRIIDIYVHILPLQYSGLTQYQCILKQHKLCEFPMCLCLNFVLIDDYAFVYFLLYSIYPCNVILQSPVRMICLAN
jgi:hypothetical protein